jgi:hypothetical protein
MATVGKITHTLRAVGGDYSSYSAWHTAQARDLTAMRKIKVLITTGTPVVGQLITFSNGATGTIATVDTKSIRYVRVGGEPTPGLTWTTASSAGSVLAWVYRDGEIEELLIYNDWPSGHTGAEVNISSTWVTSSSCFVQLRVANGHRHKGRLNSGYYYVCNNPALTQSAFKVPNYTHFEGMGIAANATGSNWANGLVYPARNLVMDGCIFSGKGMQVASTLGTILCNNLSYSTVIRNCLFLNSKGQYALYCTQLSSGLQIINNTMNYGYMGMCVGFVNITNIKSLVLNNLFTYPGNALNKSGIVGQFIDSASGHNACSTGQVCMMDPLYTSPLTDIATWLTGGYPDMLYRYKARTVHESYDQEVWDLRLAFEDTLIMKKGGDLTAYGAGNDCAGEFRPALSPDIGAFQFNYDIGGRSFTFTPKSKNLAGTFQKTLQQTGTDFWIEYTREDQTTEIDGLILHGVWQVPLGAGLEGRTAVEDSVREYLWDFKNIVGDLVVDANTANERLFERVALMEISFGDMSQNGLLEINFTFKYPAAGVVLTAACTELGFLKLDNTVLFDFGANGEIVNFAMKPTRENNNQLKDVFRGKPVVVKNKMTDDFDNMWTFEVTMTLDMARLYELTGFLSWFGLDPAEKRMEIMRVCVELARHVGYVGKLQLDPHRNYFSNIWSGTVGNTWTGVEYASFTPGELTNDRYVDLTFVFRYGLNYVAAEW